jgi:hypothetical protein
MDALVVPTLWTLYVGMCLGSRCSDVRLGMKLQRTYQCRVSTKVMSHSHLFSVIQISLSRRRAHGQRRRGTQDVLCDSEQIVLVHTLILDNLFMRADSTSVCEKLALRVCLGIQQVIAF